MSETVESLDIKINATAKAYINGDIIETTLENTAFIVGILFNAK